MDVDASALLRAPAPAVFAALEDLATYPQWLSIVDSAAAAPDQAGDEGPAWFVVLIGRVGPLARRKQVRMVRTAHDRENGLVRFERREGDGRAHSAWVLSSHAEADRSCAGTRLSVHIHYGGAGQLPGVDILLRHEAQRAGPRLDDLLRRTGS